MIKLYFVLASLVQLLKAVLFRDKYQKEYILYQLENIFERTQEIKPEIDSKIVLEFWETLPEVYNDEYPLLLER